MARHVSGSDASSVLRRIGVALISARARAIMSIGIVLGLGAVGTLAAWSDTATATSGTFTTGNIDIQLNDSNSTVTLTSLARVNMVAGSSASSNVKVTNAGSVPFNYKILASASATIAPYFITSFYAGAAVGSPATTCSGTLLGSLTTMTSTLETLKFNGGDTSVPLSNGTNGAMCLSVSMPATTASPGTTQTGTVSYSFVATAP